MWYHSWGQVSVCSSGKRIGNKINPKTRIKTRIAYAEGRVKPLARLLRCATALRVTAPLGCGSDGWYGRKVPFGASAPNMNDNILYHALARPRAPRPDPPLSPRKQRVFRIGPQPSRARSGEANP